MFYADRRTDRQTQTDTDRQTQTDRHRQTDTDRQTGMTKLVVAFRNFAGASSNVKIEFWIIVFKSVLFTSIFYFILLLVPAIGVY